MDRACFAAAVERYQDMVYRVAFHVLANPQDADDAVQEVFLKLYTSQKPMEGEEHLRRWLLRVTINHCRDVLRSPWRKRRAPLEDVPEQPVFQKPEQQALYQTVMDLPERHRIVLVLFYYEELSVREIGELLKLSTSAVTTRLSRARAKLKEQLGEVWQDD
jgi:RNA polymerase sigma-70 factor (ECF subfamily)